MTTIVAGRGAPGSPAAQSDLRPGQSLEGFAVRAVTPLPNLRATAYQLEHERSGARLLHVHSADSENLFAVTFPTPPADDTGLPHILEHAVLGGSRKFPVKEPFFEMVKMSMATFINAMTAPLFTTYPVASNVKRDFFNLAEVYCDAVFHPELREETFRREGHHFALAKNDDAASELLVKGIVYNEMKGMYSNPEAYVWRVSSNALFPDTALGRDSGGDPERIPELTFEQLRRFHETHYHPSNAYIFIYGDIPTREHLAFLKDKLDAFDRRDLRLAWARQPRWSQPRRESRTYPIAPGEGTANKTYLTLTWLAGDATDADEMALWWVLDAVLLGNEAAPLRKALIDSKLGADLFYSGVGGQLEATFRVGLKGSEPDRADAFEALVLGTLRQVAEHGVERSRVEAAFQQLAYHHREIQTLFPLRLLGASNALWPLGADPLRMLRVDERLDEARRRYEADPGVFGRLIRERLLDNPHRMLMVFTPDPQMQARADAAFARRMTAQRGGLSEEQLRAIGKAAAALEEVQGKPNPPEALARLPQLKVSDLPARPRHIPTTVEQLDGGLELLRNDVFANGVNYLHLDFDLNLLPAELIAYLPRYRDAFAKLGAAGQPFTRLAERKAACTGGVGAYHAFYTHAADPARTLRRLRLHLKTLDGQMPDALAVLRDLLFGLDPRDAGRLRDVVTQSRAWYRTSLVNDGSGTALRHAARGLSPQGWLNEQTGGLPQLPLIEALADDFTRRGEELMANIEAIRDHLLVRGRWTASFTGSDREYEIVRRTLAEWHAAMRPADEAAPEGGTLLPFLPYAAPPREGLAGPMQVAFCAAVMPAPHGAHADAPLLDLAARFVGLDYVLNEIRFKGNAYGAGCYYDGSAGALGLYSYRDPRIAGTLAVFRGLGGFVAAADWTQADIDRAIIGSAKHAERPIRPSEATDTALTRHLRGDTPGLREQRYAATLAATPVSVKRVLLEQLEANQPRTAVCVVSSREKLEQANRELGGEGLVIEEILKR